MIPSVISKVHNAKLNDELNVEMWGDGTVKGIHVYRGLYRFFIFFN